MTGTHVTLNMEQFSLDVTSHELMHAELAERLGYWARITRLPTWFDGNNFLMCFRIIDIGYLQKFRNLEQRRVGTLSLPIQAALRSRWTRLSDHEGLDDLSVLCSSLTSSAP